MDEVEALYDRWELIQEFLVNIDEELEFAAVEKVELEPRALAVTLTRIGSGRVHETVIRRYSFAQRP